MQILRLLKCERLFSGVAVELLCRVLNWCLVSQVTLMCEKPAMVPYQGGFCKQH